MSFLIIFFAYIFQAEVGIDMVAVEIDMEAAEVAMVAVGVVSDSKDMHILDSKKAFSSVNV